MREDLAQRVAAGCVVITPNRRLAARLKQQYDTWQAGSGRLAWQSADILAFSAFIERAYEDALYSDQAAALPIVLTPAQEQALWEAIIRESGPGKSLLAIPETAALAREAWQLAHAWQLAPRAGKSPSNEDGKAFQQWAQRYEGVTRRERQTDAARLSDITASLLARAEVRKPESVVHYGFDLVMPQQAALFAALASAGCEVASAGPEPRAAAPLRVACADGTEELRRAAVWARARLEADGAARIGIVVPDLAKHRQAIRRVFSAVMEPDYALPGSPRPAFPFNISLGEPLASYPLVNAAFLVLELAGREVDFERASRLIRSPFLTGADSELAQRARLDARLRKRAEPILTLERLLTLIAREDAGCPILAQRLAALAEFRRNRLLRGQAPSAWARAIADALALVGFPGDRGLDSTEFQTLARWHEAVADLAALDRVVPRAGYAEAVSRLRRMAGDALFQPETPDVPIQVLGELEAAGMEFDHLWVMSLSDEAWPRGARPNPFLPIELQRAAGIPQGSAAGMLELARRLTRGWLACTGEVVLSHPRREDDREFKPSPLIAAVPERALALPAYASYRDAVHALRRIEHGEDCKAPPLAGAVVEGGGHPGPCGVSVPRARASSPRRRKPESAACRARRDGARHAGAPGAGRGMGAVEDAKRARGDRAGRARRAARPGGGGRRGAHTARAADCVVGTLRRDREAAPRAPRARVARAREAARRVHGARHRGPAPHRDRRGEPQRAPGPRR
jgi:probable DNA repair protein